MAVAIAEVTAEGADLLSESAQDRVAARWARWAENATDVGVQTRQVLGSATRAARGRGEERPTAADLHAAAAALHRRTGKTAGNGSLMRTALPGQLTILMEVGALLSAQVGKDRLTGEERLALIGALEAVHRIGGANAPRVESDDIETPVEVIAEKLAEAVQHHAHA